LGARWDRLLPDVHEYERRAGPDAPTWENVGTAQDTNTFPHTVPKTASDPTHPLYEPLDYTPFGNELLISFAEQAIEHEQLGADADTDVLTVSFSSNDYVGHRFGPYSQEAMDITLRVDQQIGALLDYVDRHVGLQNTVVIFTADHGVAPIPEHATALGLSGGRINGATVLTAVRNAIKAHYVRTNEPKDTTADYVLDTFLNGNVYFNMTALKRDGIDRAELERVTCEGALTVPGIARCFTRTQLEQGSTSAQADPVARRALHGFYSRRSGEVVLVQDPYKYFTEGTGFIAATHGTPYSYDTHVPVIIMGRGVTAGRYAQAATPADIAPTLASLLRVQPPSNATGRILSEALGGK
jgi:arylsulfatase A-like enzyme